MNSVLPEPLDPISDPNFSQMTWINQLATPQQILIRQSFDLYEREISEHSNWQDYSFVLFPIAKAYEGFLKDFLFKLGLLSAHQYQGNHFRIGRALNPDLPERYRDEWWLYDDMTKVCGQQLAREIWNGWLEGRNHVFHYFTKDPIFQSLPEIRKKIAMLANIMQQASESIKS